MIARERKRTKRGERERERKINTKEKGGEMERINGQENRMGGESERGKEKEREVR